MEFRNLVINGLLMGLFIIAIVSFGTYLSSQNNVPNVLLQDESFNSSYSSLQTELESSQDKAEIQSQVQEQTAPTTSSGNLIIESTPSTLTSFKGMLKNIWSIIFTLLGKTLGIPPIVFYVFGAILTLTIILLIWRVIIQG